MSITIQLPKVKSEKDNRWISQKFGIIGAPGIGKSELLSYGNTLYIQTEAGLNHLEVFKVVMHNWQDFRDIYSALVEAKQKNEFPYDCICIDTIDRFKNIIDQETVARGKAKFTKIADSIHTVGDIPNGAGWAWSTEMMNMAFKKLEEFDCAIAFIGHETTKEVKTPTDSHHKSTINIGGQLGGNLLAWPDHLLNITAHTDSQGNITRIVRTRPTNVVEAKSRDGVIPDGWKWESDSKKNYEKLRSLFK